MKKLVLLFCCCYSLLFVSAQKDSIQTTPDTATEKKAAAWLKDIYEMGIEMSHDSIKMNGECKRIVSDASYRNAIYPEQYSWGDATYLLKNREFKKAFWYLINLYAADTANRSLVVNALFPFDQIMEMDKVLTSTFYTYAMLDPKVSVLVNGRFQVMHPDVLEHEFEKVKELVGYILYFRKKEAQKKKDAIGK